MLEVEADSDDVVPEEKLLTSRQIYKALKIFANNDEIRSLNLEQKYLPIQ